MLRKLVLLTFAAAALSACHPKPAANATPAAQAEQPSPEAAAQEAKGKVFLAENARKPGVQVLPDGVQYQVLQSGPATGSHPQKGDEIKVHYEGKLLDGAVFDSSYERGEPAAMPLANLIPAWEEVIPMMRPGDVWMIYVPAKEGYGNRGAGDAIPPGATLIFKIELIDFLPSRSRIANG